MDITLKGGLSGRTCCAGKMMLEEVADVGLEVKGGNAESTQKPACFRRQRLS